MLIQRRCSNMVAVCMCLPPVLPPLFSFPAEASEWLKHTSEIDDDDRDETVYRLCGNSIPVLTLRDVIEHIVTNIIKPQVLTECTAAAEAHRAARREMLEALQTAAV